ncbi:outer membrane homotrimeric porin [uncultured Desulfovibrio sp.]|uniref:outer membrane homotrimeric porin n=1 Tax=uncultured Desulfovibrio sp. TaxID=167968 RepID=UPI00344229D5
MKKKLAVLLLAAGMLLGASGSASAIDFKVKGWWWMAFDYASGGDFMGKSRTGARKTGSRQQGPHIPMDEFEAWNRLMFKLDAVVNENLSGTLMFEIGDQMWGQSSTGGALGADGAVVELKNAYIDWMVPNTDLKLRMGLQLVALPSFTFENNVFIDDVAGVTASYAFNENVSLTGFWMRPYNDNYTQNIALGHNEHNNFLDNMDMFGLTLPMRFDGINVTPWAMMAGIGPNVMALTSADDPLTGVPRLGTNPAVINPQAGQTWGQFTSGMLPAAISTNDQRLRNDSYSTGVWAGLTGEVTMLDPWRFAWDVNYGSLTGDKGYLNRSGWMFNALLEYKMDWATPGIYGWYSSGDDDNPHNGSERIPTISQVNIGENSLSNFGFRASPWVNNEGVLGGNAVGLWGVGAPQGHELHGKPQVHPAGQLLRRHQRHQDGLLHPGSPQHGRLGPSGLPPLDRLQLQLRRVSDRGRYRYRDQPEQPVQSLRQPDRPAGTGLHPPLAGRKQIGLGPQRRLALQ